MEFAPNFDNTKRNQEYATIQVKHNKTKQDETHQAKVLLH